MALWPSRGRVNRDETKRNFFYKPHMDVVASYRALLFPELHLPKIKPRKNEGERWGIGGTYFGAVLTPFFLLETTAIRTFDKPLNPLLKADNSHNASLRKFPIQRSFVRSFCYVKGWPDKHASLSLVSRLLDCKINLSRWI